MKTLMKTLVCLTLLGMLACPPEGEAASPSVYQLVIPAIPHGLRIMGIKLSIISGRFAGVTDCPAGWSISINNDPNWSATLDARAIVGAAAISTRQASPLILVSGGTDAEQLSDQKGISVRGELTTLRDGPGDLKTIKLDHVDLIPAARH
ncbi:hypothetical protein NFI95_10270 [Acetobacteraceae bacterium KSS8]|uniref:Uncharacterized protein n=1 Tax=Endosaccharibacter trunci TaxID=2812733 RepID=A0ABT1W9C2_9PROT|nr:hypothetical protein [Acetobacteraceae bacterium KSS8]